MNKKKTLSDQLQKIDPHHLLTISIKKYQGPELQLKDGTTINTGDSVGELYIKTELLYRMQQKCENKVKAAMCIKRGLKESLESLAKLFSQQQIDIKALYGYTIFHQSARLLGFEITENQSFQHSLLNLRQNFLLLVYSLFYPARSKPKYQYMEVKTIWISRENFLKNF